MIWTKKTKCRWVNERGNEIVKYRMAGEYVFLCYYDGYKEYGDYESKCSLSMAKSYFGDHKFK